jgi:hypothetical protein
MSHSLRLLLVGLVLVIAVPVASAQDATIAAQMPRREIGVDGATVLPVGDYGEVATLGIGALGRVDFPIAPQLAVTARAGVVFHLLEDGLEGSLTLVPIYGGIRYFLSSAVPGEGPYLAAETGITIGFAEVDTGFGTASDSDSEIGATAGAGYKRGALDFRGGLFIPDLGEADDLAIMGSVGFGFATF